MSQRTDVYGHGEKEHGRVERGDWRLEILERGKREFDRRFKESLWIGRMRGSCLIKSSGMQFI